jgi:hypothetical protein
VRVYVYPSDLGGCGYYRLIWPAKRLQQLGYDIKIVHPKQANKIKGGTDADGKLIQISRPNDADVMVFQRVTSRLIVDGIDIIRKSGTAVVLDVDDDMSAIDQRNPAWVALHPKSTGRTAEYDWNSALRSCERATFVTVSSDALLPRYAKHGRGVVLRNCVPEILTKIAHEEEPDTIGWGGSMHSHPDDPQMVGSSMGRLYREGYKFKIVGPSHGTRTAFQLDTEPLSTGAVEIQRWPHELTKLAVGVAPLNGTRFNEAKSWLKMLEYAALGVPCIGSPRAEYRKIHALGVGLLADNPKEWYRHAKSLLTDDARRGEMSAAGRVAVAQLTIEANAWRWLEAWTRAFEIERGPLGIRHSEISR